MLDVLVDAEVCPLEDVELVNLPQSVGVELSGEIRARRRRQGLKMDTLLNSSKVR